MIGRQGSCWSWFVSRPNDITLIPKTVAAWPCGTACLLETYHIVSDNTISQLLTLSEVQYSCARHRIVNTVSWNWMKSFTSLLPNQSVLWETCCVIAPPTYTLQQHSSLSMDMRVWGYEAIYEAHEAWNHNSQHVYVDFTVPYCYGLRFEPETLEP